MIKKLIALVSFVLLIHISCLSQNMAFSDLLIIQKKNYNQTNSYLNAKAGWKYSSSSTNADFYDFNSFKWSYKINPDNDNAECWLWLCQKTGFENVVIYSTNSEQFYEIKKNVTNDSHWKFVNSFLDKNGIMHYNYGWTKYYFEFIESPNEMQILFYNNQEINKLKVEKLRLEQISDSIAKIAEEKRFKEKHIQDSISAIVKHIQDSIYAIKAKRESDSISEVKKIAAAIEKKEIQAKTYNIRDFDIYSRLYANMLTGISNFVETLPKGKKINSIFKFKISMDINRHLTISPSTVDETDMPELLVDYMNKWCNDSYYSYPKIKGYDVNAETDINIPVVYQKGTIKLFKKKKGKLNFNRGTPSQAIQNEITGRLYSEAKGVYFFKYTEKIIDEKSTNTITQTNYKKTTVFRAIATVFGSIIGIGGLVTLAIIAKTVVP